MHGDACHDAWNGSGTDFGASQCFPMDLDAAAAADADAAAAAAARCVHSFTDILVIYNRTLCFEKSPTLHCS